MSERPCGSIGDPISAIKREREREYRAALDWLVRAGTAPSARSPSACHRELFYPPAAQWSSSVDRVSHPAHYKQARPLCRAGHPTRLGTWSPIVGLAPRVLTSPFLSPPHTSLAPLS